MKALPRRLAGDSDEGPPAAVRARSGQRKLYGTEAELPQAVMGVDDIRSTRP